MGTVLWGWARGTIFLYLLSEHLVDGAAASAWAGMADHSSKQPEQPGGGGRDPCMGQ